MFINIRLKSKFSTRADLHPCAREREDILCCACTTDGLSNPDLSSEGEGRLHLFLSIISTIFLAAVHQSSPIHRIFLFGLILLDFPTWQFYSSTHRGNEEIISRKKMCAKRYFFNTNLFSPFSIFLLFQRSKYHGKIRDPRNLRIESN